MNVTCEYILFGLYLVAGPLWWVVYGAGMILGRKRMMLDRKGAPPLPNPAPKVSIIIPAKDEGERIADCLTAALTQEYPNIEVIAVDDRSTDQTGTIMDRLAENNSNLRVIHVPHEPLPPRWTGKNHAVHTGYTHATGEWLLFVDSDVLLFPTAVSRTISIALAKKFDLVSLMTRLENRSFWEQLIVPLAGAAITGLYTAMLTNDSNLKGVAFANGQFMLFRRSAYEAIGGHSAIRDHFGEDIYLARMIKSAGFRPRVMWGMDLASVRMYGSLGQIIRGWGRIFFASDDGRIGRILLGILVVLFGGLSVYAAAPWGIYRWLHPITTYGAFGWIAAATFHWTLMTLLIAGTYRWTGNPRRNALLFPLGAFFLLAIFFRGLRNCLTGKVEWRGTRYAQNEKVGSMSQT